jgi:hypothetical protein
MPATDTPVAAATEIPATLDPNSLLAPEIRSDVWINSKPLDWSSLRGRVVMIEFWTYG